MSINILLTYLFLLKFFYIQISSKSYQDCFFNVTYDTVKIFYSFVEYKMIKMKNEPLFIFWLTNRLNNEPSGITNIQNNEPSFIFRLTTIRNNGPSE